MVPSNSDVMDILNIASGGMNEVTSENLKQVKVSQNSDVIHNFSLLP